MTSHMTDGGTQADQELADLCAGGICALPPRGEHHALDEGAPELGTALKPADQYHLGDTLNR